MKRIIAVLLLLCSLFVCTEAQAQYPRRPVGRPIYGPYYAPPPTYYGYPAYPPGYYQYYWYGWRTTGPIFLDYRQVYQVPGFYYR